ncbi:type 4a pilus biogenesis protein PilO [Patescibacteria group bacterium]|nr:type 4a pilus biogenesis protein PilO [Patescibacteria group bacterium]
MALSSRNLTLLLSFMAVVVLGGGGYFAYDQYGNMEIKKTELETKQTEKEALEQEVADLNTLITEYQKAKASVSEVNNILPSKEALPELIYQLEDIASKEAGVLFEGASFSEVEDTTVSAAQAAASGQPAIKKGLKKVAVNVGVRGTYTGLKQYLDALQENMRLIDVTSVEFSSNVEEGEAAGLNVFDYKIGMLTYYQEQ